MSKRDPHPSELFSDCVADERTALGAMYYADPLELLRGLASDSVSLAFMPLGSPSILATRAGAGYVPWLDKHFKELRRVVRETGVLVIRGARDTPEPLRETLAKAGFHVLRLEVWAGDEHVLLLGNSNMVKEASVADRQSFPFCPLAILKERTEPGDLVIELYAESNHLLLDAELLGRRALQVVRTVESIVDELQGAM